MTCGTQSVNKTKASLEVISNIKKKRSIYINDGNNKHLQQL